MKTFELPENIKPIWPEPDSDDPRYTLRKYGFHEDVKHNKTCEQFLEACESGNIDAVKAFIELGIDLEFRNDISEISPLTRAVEGDRIEIIKTLIDAGADIEGRDGSGDTPLMTAINWSNILSAKTLLKLGANPDAADPYNNTPLSKSIEEDKEDYIKLLFEYGASPNSFADEAESSLHKAIDDEDMERLQMLLNNGGDPDLSDKNGLSLLVYAVKRDNSEAFEILIDHGAKTSTDYNGWSLYDIAVLHGIDVLDFIPDRELVKKTDLLFLKSAGKGDMDSVIEMLEDGADINSLTYENKNAVRLAMSEEFYDVALYLAEKGVDLKHKDIDGSNVIGYCTDGNTAVKLLEMGADPNSEKDGKSVCELISPALDSDDTGFLKAAIDFGAAIKDLSHTNLTFNYGEGSDEGLAEAVSIIKEAGGDLEAAEDNGATLLINSAYRVNKTVLKALLDAEVNINARDKYKDSALIKACDSFDDHDEVAQIVKILLERGADYSFLNWQENSCYDLAVSRDNEPAKEVIEAHMEKTLEYAARKAGSDRYSEDFFKELNNVSNYETLLHFVRGNRINIVEGLLKEGMNPNSPSELGKQALTVAIENEFEEIVDLLLEHGAEPDTLELYGNSPYLAAINTEEIKYLDKLFKKGMNPNQGDDWCSCRVSSAVDKGIEMVKFLHENGASLEMYPVGYSPLYTAVNKENFELCEFLLSKGANINIRNSYRKTPLMAAVENEVDIDFIHALIEAKADLNSQDEKGETALIIAAKKGNSLIIEMLLNKGADPQIKDNNGESAISLAAYRDELKDLFREYIKDGGEKEHTVVVDKPLSPLLFSIYSQNMEEFEELVENPETDMDETNYRGDTPLMIAIAFNNIQMMEKLLDKGADIKKKNIFNDTAWSYSFVDKDPSIRKKLEDLGAGLDMDALNQWADMSMRREDIIKSFKAGDISKIIEHLDKKELDVNYLFAGNSPIEYARYLDDEALEEVLIAKGADEDLVEKRQLNM